MLQDLDSVFATIEGLNIVVYSSRLLKRKRAGNYPLVAGLHPQSPMNSDHSSDFEDEREMHDAMIPSTGCWNSFIDSDSPSFARQQDRQCRFLTPPRRGIAAADTAPPPSAPAGMARGPGRLPRTGSFDDLAGGGGRRHDLKTPFLAAQPGGALA
mmetsp:Transcript_21309/g.44756  ORF Transcript_21309/g.44756 Transcript_21309/m.44756 type:complete len:155 (-) Transcript_21309:180-644(-)